jgi:hypothetical protein
MQCQHHQMHEASSAGLRSPHVRRCCKYLGIMSATQEYPPNCTSDSCTSNTTFMHEPCTQTIFDQHFVCNVQMPELSVMLPWHCLHTLPQLSSQSMPGAVQRVAAVQHARLIHRNTRYDYLQWRLKAYSDGCYGIQGTESQTIPTFTVKQALWGVLVVLHQTTPHLASITFSLSRLQCSEHRIKV